MNRKKLLLIFTKNPELGKCKTRLAKIIGDEAALKIYCYLLKHTAKITQSLSVDKRVYYSNEIIENDDFSAELFDKKIQQGNDLGEKMANAFQEGFQAGYEQIVIVGSDLFELSQSDIEETFSALTTSDVVLGPAKDGGYYLLGMKTFLPELFQQKKWSTSHVLKDTLADLQDKNVTLISEKNDIDEYKDMENIPVLQQLLNS